MSEALTVLNNQSLAQGGIGLDSNLFKLKPATLEIVQRTSRQEGAEPGRFRITATNEHFDKMQLVLLMNPILQREYYPKGAEFGRDSKACFSLDNITPHPKAKDPVAPYCATCPMGDVNWEKWRVSHNANDLPPCKAYYHLVVADRATQMPYYFNVKGRSVEPFKAGMQNVARLIAALQANAKAENKKIAGENSVEGAIQKPFVPMPNIFDITFPVTIASQSSASGISYVLVVGKPVQMNAEGKAEFGALYLDFAKRKASGNVQTAEESEAAAQAKEYDEVSNIVSEAPARSEVAAVVGTVTGVVVPKSDITI